MTAESLAELFPDVTVVLPIRFNCTGRLLRGRGLWGGWPRVLAAASLSGGIWSEVGRITLPFAGGKHGLSPKIRKDSPSPIDCVLGSYDSETLDRR